MSAGPEFAVTITSEGDRHTLLLRGELDLAAAPEFEQAAALACAQGARELVVDLAELDFIDSTGLRALLACMHLCEQRGCAFSVTPGRPQVERLFDVVGVREVLPFRARGER